jgi:diketogulonate reductase-like aldo/keto reductase
LKGEIQRNLGLSGLEKLVAGLSLRKALRKITNSAIIQVEIRPFLLNTELVEYCFAHGILPVVYAPLGSQGQTEATQEA